MAQLLSNVVAPAVTSGVDSNLLSVPNPSLSFASSHASGLKPFQIGKVTPDFDSTIQSPAQENITVIGKTLHRHWNMSLGRGDILFAHKHIPTDSTEPLLIWNLTMANHHARDAAVAMKAYQDDFARDFPDFMCVDESTLFLSDDLNDPSGNTGRPIDLLPDTYREYFELQTVTGFYNYFQMIGVLTGNNKPAKDYVINDAVTVRGQTEILPYPKDVFGKCQFFHLFLVPTRKTRVHRSSFVQKEFVYGHVEWEPVSTFKREVDPGLKTSLAFNGMETVAEPLYLGQVRKPAKYSAGEAAYHGLVHGDAGNKFKNCPGPLSGTFLQLKLDPNAYYC